MGPWCRIITIVALHAKLLLATLPRFPSESSRSDASHVSKQRTPSPLAIQKTQVFEAVENGRQRLRARRLSLNVTKGQIPIWKDRRFQQRRTCSKTADCEPNDYCMSCAKCAEYHAHLPKEQQRRWTCDPCGDTEHICESGKYCTVAQDPVEGSCPSSYPGCSDHAECGADEYCFSCQKCDEYINTKGDNQSIWRCEPCPTTKGGFCSKLWWCPLREDSITGSCPAEQGCGKHSDCKEGEFCEGCQKCLDFQASLSESARANWPCEPCPTTEGGICEPTRLCQLGNTGIDGTCPPEKGCNSHVQCLPDEYCMDCQKCEAYRDSLSESQRAYWPCGYCPTGRGGHCERRIFCSVADDGVSECPLYEGCFKHQDCKDHEFCWSWKKCQEEDVQNSGTCGDKPRKDGFCNVMSTCNTRRSIDGQCRGAKACNSHRECGDGLYCVSWSKCNERSPDICGPEPAHRAGICLPIEHCVHGFHPPLGGECPAWSAHNGSAGGHLEVSEVLKLNSTLMLAVWGQAMNSWRWIRPNQERDLMLAHLHDYASNSTVLDDSEHVGIYEVTAGKMQQQDQVQLSCPFVEVAIPAHGPRFYEARIFMDEMEMSQKHAECSCILGESGRCPRGARFLVPSIPPDPPDFCIDPPVLNEEILPNYTLNYLQSCSGSVQVDTYSTFTLESPGASVRYLRLDSFQIEEVSVPGAGGLKLIFDGQNLQCEATLMAFTHCGTLQRGKKIPVVLSFLTVGSEPTKNTLDLKRYCTNCRAAIKRFHPVFFYDSNGQALRNSLSLYSMGEDMKRRAKLVDSRRSLPETGVGESTHGCPVSEAATSKGVSLSELRDKKVLPPDYQDHWCVVQVGTCSITSKVKYCIVGGAAGVLIMEAPGDSPDPTRPVPDKQGQVYLSDGESLNRMVPVIYSVYNEQLWNALMDPAGATVLLEVGPNVGVRPANSHAVSPGGVRIYDSLTKQWHFGGGGFGAERWMEHSQVRDILFVCTASEQLIALDTSRPDYMLVKVGQAPDWLKCGRSSTPRDRHLLDFKPGCPLGTALASPSLASLCGFARRNFISLYVDAEDDRNHLIFFDTESLSDWKLLTEVHANWEHETDGLGQVVVTQDSSKLLVTWHCSTIHCGTSRRTDGSAVGEHIYVLDLMQGLELGHAPPVLAAVHVPMSPGSIIRDVQCNDQRLCLVSLSWDGVAVIDMAEGPNRFKVIAEHSATFAGWASPFQGELAEDLAYLRMVVGAQKVVASRSRRNRFYIERWSFDMEGWSTNGGKLMDSLRFDSIWAVDVENYVRPTFDVAFAPDFDPAVSGRLIMPRVSWARVSAQMREFEIKMIKGLQEALKVDPARIKVLSSKRSGEGDEGVEMDFTILDGKGSSPETLFNALWRQLTLPFSALHRSQIKEEVSGASLIRVGPLPISLQQSRSIARVMHPDPTDGFFRVLLVLALLVLAGFTLWLLVRSKNAMNKLREENRQLKADLHRHTELAGNAPLAHATGYVIGRPESHQGSPSGKDPDARDTAGSLSYVVGSPIPEPPAREAPSAQSVQARDASDQPEDKPPAEQDGVASTVRAPTRPVGSD